MAEASVPDAKALLARLKAHQNGPVNLEAERHRVLWLGEGLIVLMHIRWQRGFLPSWAAAIQGNRITHS